jgi:proton-translocating NADH-quinone oxidoreductase chain N
MAEAINFIMLYIAVELVCISSYVLVGFTKTNSKSNEASFKYLLIGTIASASMLYGFSLFYGFTGTTNLSKIGHLLLSSQDVPYLILPLLLMLIGFGFKIAAVPMHMWCPDVYEGAPTPVTAFLSVGPKAAGFAVLIRVLTTAFNSIKPDWIIILALLSVFTMTLGNLTALAQKNIKRMLAYSSISQAGYILIGLAAVESVRFAVPGILIYLLIYLFMNLGAFICVIIFEKQTGSENIDDYAGLSQRSSILAFCLTVFFLSLAGIPPLGGFIGKFFIFAAAIETGFIWLAIAGVVNSVISIYYYFNVVRLMYLVPCENKSAIINPPFLKLALYTTVFFTFLIGLFPHLFITFASFK